MCVLRRPELKNVGVPADGVLGLRITLQDLFFPKASRRVLPCGALGQVT